MTEEKLSPWEKKALIERLVAAQKQAMRDYDSELYDMLEARLVELRAPEPEPPEAWEYPAAVATAPVVELHQDGTKSSYETVVAEMDLAYLHLTATFEWHSKKLKAQWAKAQKNIPEKHGWTEESFYEELDSRIRRKTVPGNEKQKTKTPEPHKEQSEASEADTTRVPETEAQDTASAL